jgi:hypothetical protein
MARARVVLVERLLVLPAIGMEPSEMSAGVGLGDQVTRGLGVLQRVREMGGRFGRPTCGEQVQAEVEV